MESSAFRTPSGTTVPAVTASEMGDIDRIAVEDVGLELIQMMEHAGRTLAGDVFDLINADDNITVLAGGGGNGGAGSPAPATSRIADTTFRSFSTDQ
jgi:NAD(P)H-hydrate epimerase